MKQFKPLKYSLQYRVRNGLKHGKWESFKFADRLSPNIPFMLRTFSKLHYLGSHSFHQEKWNQTEIRFIRAHRRIDL